MYLYYDYYVNFDWCRKVQLHGDSWNSPLGDPECGRCTSGRFFPGVRLGPPSSQRLRVRERTTSAGLREPPQRWWPPVAQRSPSSAEPTVCAVPFLIPARIAQATRSRSGTADLKEGAPLEEGPKATETTGERRQHDTNQLGGESNSICTQILCL
eukprot:COSAG02_NODE_1_length_108762_cov_456.708287_73_plen_155_part_00